MIEIIELNNESEENTFINKLKYEKYFDRQLLLELINGIIKQAFSSVNQEQKKNDLCVIFNLYSYTTICLISHFNKNDLYLIKNYEEDILDYVDVFREIIKCFINDDKEGLSKYETPPAAQSL